MTLPLRIPSYSADILLVSFLPASSYYKTSNTHLLMCCKGGEVNQAKDKCEVE